MSYIQTRRAPSLTVQAGSIARQHIEKEGLFAKDVHIIPGAAGGPKGLGLHGLDQAIFGEFLPQAPQRRALVGSSIGSWRFASILAHGVQHGSDLLADLYTRLEFYKGMKYPEISAICQNMLQQLIAGREQHIVSHPDYHLVILATKAQHIFQSDRTLPLLASVGGIMATNAVARRYSGFFMQRVVAQPQSDNPLKFLADRDFKTHYQDLTADNLNGWLMASGSIPGVMAGIRDIPHAPAGCYRDGGLIDYHLDLPYPTQGIVLYPHFGDKILPGWFDKFVKWRNVKPKFQQRTVLISPSAAYLASLPNKRLPDRKDFEIYADNPQKRMQIWQQCIAESRRLADEFLELVEKQRFAEVIRPLAQG